MKSLLQKKEKEVSEPKEEKEEKEEEEEGSLIPKRVTPKVRMICINCIVHKKESYWCRDDLYINFALTHFLAVLLKRAITDEDRKAYYLALPNSQETPLDPHKKLTDYNIKHNDTLICK